VLRAQTTETVKAIIITGNPVEKFEFWPFETEQPEFDPPVPQGDEVHDQLKAIGARASAIPARRAATGDPLEALRTRSGGRAEAPDLSKRLWA
jgi:hypothetical protein